MKQSDFDRLKAVCEKEGFELLNESASDNDKFFLVKKAKDIWEGVQFAECISNQAKNEYTLGKIYPIIEKTIDTIRTLYDDKLEKNGWIKCNFKPSTESAYIDQLKTECFKMFGDIKEGDRFELNREIGKISDLFITSWIYRKETDSFGKHGTVLYQQGKWATRVKERVKVDFSMSETCDNSYKVYFGINNAAKVIRDQNGLDIGKYLASKLEEYLNKE